MMNVPLYPLRFTPIYQPRIWGGRRLVEWLGGTAPAGAIGEAWVLSDQDQYPSRVADGPLQGRTLRELLEEAGERILGRPVANGRFPLLLKFLDARDTLSVQVHPDDRHTDLLPPGQRGKTEAWVVLQAEPGSRIYAGLKPGVGPAEIRRALKDRSLADCLESFAPKPGDCVFLPAGTVHALGGGAMLFEVQQNSDVTFRLYDWDRVDAQAGRPRPLHIEQALACIDYTSHVRGPVVSQLEEGGSIRRERLARCKHFDLWRIETEKPFSVNGSCRILVELEGRAQLRHAGQTCSLNPGDVVLLPAELGDCVCEPAGAIRQLEITL